jgi:hypothetical protein
VNHEKLPVVAELEKLYAHLNAGLFEKTLPSPAFVLQPDKKVVFKFSPTAVAMTVGAGFVSVKNEYDLACHFLHEMVHISNVASGIEDCTSNQYHNKHFLHAALAVGLYVYRHKTQGWSVTHLNESAPGEFQCPPTAARDRLHKLLQTLPITMDVIRGVQKQMKGHLRDNKPKPCFLKYVCDCPPPHNSVRSGRRPDSSNAPLIKCERCGGRFKFSEN